MEQRGTILSWKLSLAETLAFGSTIAVLVFFITGNFQSKDDAKKLEDRIKNVEDRMEKLSDGIYSIAKSVEYIRGRLEPQVPKK